MQIIINSASLKICIINHGMQSASYPGAFKKTFLFRPLELLFNTFSNPAADKYACVGADKKEIIGLTIFAE